jgi:general secretion pathway protein K
LLSTLAATVGYVSRTNAILTHRNLERAQAQAAADGAIIDVISRLSDEESSRHPTVGRNSQHWELSGIGVDIALTDEEGRIDLNSAAPDLISAFLQSQGISPDGAAAMLGDLANRIGSTREPRQIGAENQNNTASGSDRTEPNVSLRSVEDLREIPTWRAQDLDCWMDSFTVYTRLSLVSVGEASRQVIDALKWAEEHHLSDREWATTVPTTAMVGQTSVIGHVLRISASARASKDLVATSRWIGRLTGDRRHPILTMRWDHWQPSTPASCSGG